MGNKSAKAKIVITVVVLISTLAFIGLGTFAWFTLSTKGTASGISVSMKRTGDEWPFELVEMRKVPATQSATPGTYVTEWTTMDDVRNAKGWSKNLTLGNVSFWNGYEHVATPANDCYKLRPISTSDLQHWYLPQYDKDGGLVGLVETDLRTVGNVNRYNPTPSQEDDEIPSNYVYYYDIWVRTLSEENSYELHLNNPFDAASADGTKYDELDYGTFVLPGLVEGDDGYAKVSECGFDMSTCLRVGFLIYKNEDENNIASESVADYWIYEPNCDVRAQHFAEYGAGTQAAYEYQKGYKYVLDNTEAGGKKVENHTTAAGDLTTLLPSAEAGGALIDIDSKTIKQLQSSWKTTIPNEEIGNVDSTDIQTFGKFLNKYTGKTSLDGIDTPKMVTISKDTPVHIRVFIWMEGQDEDCWNSSLSGSLKIGLEFRGDVAQEQVSN